eukprot:748937-Hanusia_phi.AAC.3
MVYATGDVAWRRMKSADDWESIEARGGEGNKSLTIEESKVTSTRRSQAGGRREAWMPPGHGFEVARPLCAFPMKGWGPMVYPTPLD